MYDKIADPPLLAGAIYESSNLDAVKESLVGTISFNMLLFKLNLIYFQMNLDFSSSVSSRDFNIRITSPRSKP